MAVRTIRSGALVVAAVMVSPVVPVAGAAPPLPGGATPGGIAPVTRPRPPETADPRVMPTIPALPQRPLGRDEGPVIVVKQFLLEGMSDEDDAREAHRELQGLIDAMRTERDGRFTIGQLQDVADRITEVYRGKGYIVSRAVVPAQEVNDGQVEIRLFEGVLGSVQVEDNEDYADALVLHAFEDLIGNPVYSPSLETAVLRTNDLPGLSVFGVFQPGEAVGETELVLKATERSWEGSVGLDNFGTEFTGEYELRFDFSFNNPTGAGDAIDLILQQAYNPKLADYVYLGYRRPFFPSWKPGHEVGIGFSRNAFQVGGELSALNIDGVTEIVTGYYRSSLIRSRRRNLAAQFELARKSAKVEASGQAFSEDRLSVFSARLEFDAIDLFLGGGINQGSATYTHGFGNFLASTQAKDLPGLSRQDQNGDAIGTGFDKFSFDYSRYQSLRPNHSLILSLSGQYSDDLLVSLEQMAIGGPYSVRAYSQAEYLVDSGLVASLEYVLNAPFIADKPVFQNRTWGQVLQVSAYLDHGSGWINRLPAGQEQSIEITGVGVGVQMFVPADVVAGLFNMAGAKLLNREWAFSFPGDMSLRLDLATPVGKRDASNGENPQTYFNVVYNY